jgi:N-acetylneuraminate synthase
MTIKRLINKLLRRVLGVELRRVTNSKKARLHNGGWNVADSELSSEEVIYCIMHELKAMLKRAKIFIGEQSSIELSHHYGLERFREFGAVIINCINRDYCKKLIIQFPGQKHPYHFHKKKEETFQLLYGDIEVEKEGERMILKPGDTVLVKSGEWHKFQTLYGAILEEISTTHYNNDSFYEDERIARLPRDMRKTYVKDWEKIIPQKKKNNYAKL